MRFLPQERCRQKFVAGSDAETGSNQTTCYSRGSVRQKRVARAIVTSETRIVAIMR